MVSIKDAEASEEHVKKGNNFLRGGWCRALDLWWIFGALLPQM